MVPPVMQPGAPAISGLPAACLNAAVGTRGMAVIRARQAGL